MNTPTFETELNAVRAIYEALRPFAIHERDRLLRMVQERLSRERAPAGTVTRVSIQDPVPPPIPFGEIRRR